MNWPFITRKEHERQMEELDRRILDIERHFVTKRDATGVPTQTLADVPLAERKIHAVTQRGMTWPQRKNLLEATDGGRRV